MCVWYVCTHVTGYMNADRHGLAKLAMQVRLTLLASGRSTQLPPTTRLQVVAVACMASADFPNSPPPASRPQCMGPPPGGGLWGPAQRHRQLKLLLGFGHGRQPSSKLTAHQKLAVTPVVDLTRARGGLLQGGVRVQGARLLRLVKKSQALRHAPDLSLSLSSYCARSSVLLRWKAGQV